MMKPMWNGLQELGVLSDLIPNFSRAPSPCKSQFSERRVHWRASALLLALVARRPVSSEQSLLTRVIIAWHCFTSLIFPHLMKPLLLPSHKKGKKVLKSFSRELLPRSIWNLRMLSAPWSSPKANFTALIPFCKYTVTTINLFDASYASCNYPSNLSLKAGCSLRFACDKGPLKSTETVHYSIPGCPCPGLNPSSSKHQLCYKPIPTSHSQLVTSRDVFNYEKRETSWNEK